MEKIINLIWFSLIFFSISTCSPVSSVVSMAANAGISSKGFSASVDDSFLKAKIIGKLSSLKLSNISDITVSTSLGEVLLTGYSSNQVNRLKIVESVWEIDGVKKLYNEVLIDP